MSGRFARIVATGRHVPERRVSNAELAGMLGPDLAENVAKLEAATGITQRFWARDDQATSDLALPAARQALQRAGRRPEDLDLLILGTDSPDYVTPATSVVLQHKLGAKNAGTFDVGCACASFPTGLAAAAGMIAANPGLRTVLVVGAYLMHRLAAPDEPTQFFYGDGAGAAVLEPGTAPGFVAAAFQADGAYARDWAILAGGTVEPASHAAIDAGRTTVKMYQRYPPEVNHQGWPRLARRLAEQGDFALDEVALWIFTQVRKPSIELVMADLGLPAGRAHTIMEKWGYTGSACIPMALDDALEQGAAGPGDLVVLLGSGVGYNQAGTAFVL
ncbi:MAG TPA: ketoacyl-ACP synthase III [Thermoanaerobaculia bacterium]|nr:ketoacyl-ACP synthase III [Thermoanaerobaculia bacterium]